MFSGILKIWKIFSRLERLIFASSLLVFAVSGIFIGANFIGEKTKEIPALGGEYREGVVGQLSFVNPVLVGENDPDRDLTEILFSDVLDLAESYKVNDKGKSWNLRLKPDARWDDGVEITSDDVIFTINLIQDPDTRSPLFLAWQGVETERVSELEFKLKLASPYAFFKNNLKDLRPIPKHIFGVLPPANIRLSSFNLEPVASGPFKFLSIEKKRDGFISQYQLTRNENYLGERPYLNNLIFKFYPSKDELIEAVNRGIVDGAGNLDAPDLEKITVAKQTYDLRMPRYNAIFFNLASAPALQEKNIRIALGLAVDRKKIIEKVFGNHALRVEGPLLPGMEGYKAAPYGEPALILPDKALSLFTENGWRPGEGGIMEKRIGPLLDKGGRLIAGSGETAKMEFNLIVPDNSFLVEAANLIASDWLKIGVKLNVSVKSHEEITNSVLKARDYEMILFGNTFGENPDPFSFWHSSERFYPGLNLSLYESRLADALLESIRTDEDETARRKDLASLNSLISGEAPAIFLFSPNYLYVIRGGLQGFEENFIALPSDRFSAIEKWYMKTKRVFK
ncbi:peptide ABC transporter substrate-binding protein [Candidatus Wolfebacteria bacterium]|nr:peptide ABC transporter substrate-binding protein [Candidatus Wolfebacteria bacterium]